VFSAPAEAWVSLIADGKASDLYAQFGFALWLKP
jgi:hypothetical protein